MNEHIMNGLRGANAALTHSHTLWPRLFSSTVFDTHESSSLLLFKSQYLHSFCLFLSCPLMSPSSDF